MCIRFVGFLIYNADTKGDNQGVVLPIKQRFKNADDMQMQFKEAYLWACSVFGVKKNVYDTLDEDCVKYPSLGVVYHTYYEVSTSTYSCYLIFLKQIIECVFGMMSHHR